MAELTQANKTALKTHMLANAAATPLINTGQYGAVAALYNQLAAPAFWGYRLNIPSDEIGTTVNYVAVAAMTTANLQRVSDFLRMNPVAFNGRDDIKTFLNDTFSGALGGQGQNTRDALDLMLRRQLRLAERVCATGTGSTAAPGTMTFEGELDQNDVSNILVNG